MFKRMMMFVLAVGFTFLMAQSSLAACPPPESYCPAGYHLEYQNGGEVCVPDRHDLPLPTPEPQIDPTPAPQPKPPSRADRIAARTVLFVWEAYRFGRDIYDECNEDDD